MKGWNPCWPVCQSPCGGEVETVDRFLADFVQSVEDRNNAYFYRYRLGVWVWVWWSLSADWASIVYGCQSSCSWSAQQRNGLSHVPVRARGFVASLNRLGTNLKAPWIKIQLLPIWVVVCWTGEGGMLTTTRDGIENCIFFFEASMMFLPRACADLR